MGGVQKGPNLDYIIYGRSLRGRSQITLCIFQGFLTTHPPMVILLPTAKVKLQGNVNITCLLFSGILWENISYITHNTLLSCVFREKSGILELQVPLGM